MNAKQITDSIVNESKERKAKIEAIAKQLQVSFDQALSLVKQEEARKEASKRYRESESYKKRLEQQKLVRRMLKQS